MDQPSEYGIKCEPGMSLNSSCQAYGQDPSSEDLSADMDLSNFLDVDEQTLNELTGGATSEWNSLFNGQLDGLDSLDPMSGVLTANPDPPPPPLLQPQVSSHATPPSPCVDRWLLEETHKLERQQKIQQQKLLELQQTLIKTEILKNQLQIATISQTTCPTATQPSAILSALTSLGGTGSFSFTPSQGGPISTTVSTNSPRHVAAPSFKPVLPLDTSPPGNYGNNKQTTAATRMSLDSSPPPGLLLQAGGFPPSPEGEDMDDDDNLPPGDKRKVHNLIEKKYRCSINDRIGLLRDMVSKHTKDNKRLQKSAVLQKTIDYINHLENTIRRLQEENNQLKEHVAKLSGKPRLPSFNSPPATPHISPRSFESSEDSGHPSSPEYLSEGSRETSPPGGVFSSISGAMATAPSNMSSLVTRLLQGSGKSALPQYLMCVLLFAVCFFNPLSYTGSRFHSGGMSHDGSMRTLNAYGMGEWERWDASMTFAYLMVWLIRFLVAGLCFGWLTLKSLPRVFADSSGAVRFWRARKQAEIDVQRGEFVSARTNLEGALAAIDCPLPISITGIATGLLWSFCSHIMFQLVIGQWAVALASMFVRQKGCGLDGQKKAGLGVTFADVSQTYHLIHQIHMASAGGTHVHGMKFYLALNALNFAEADRPFRRLSNEQLGEMFFTLGLQCHFSLPYLSTLPMWYYFYCFGSSGPSKYATPLKWAVSPRGKRFLMSRQWGSEVKVGSRLYQGLAALPLYSVTRAYCKELLRDTFTAHLLPEAAPGSHDQQDGAEESALQAFKHILNLAKEANSNLVDAQTTEESLKNAAGMPDLGFSVIQWWASVGVVTCHWSAGEYSMAEDYYPCIDALAGDSAPVPSALQLAFKANRMYNKQPGVSPPPPPPLKTILQLCASTSHSLKMSVTDIMQDHCNTTENELHQLGLLLACDWLLNLRVLVWEAHGQEEGVSREVTPGFNQDLDTLSKLVTLLPSTLSRLRLYKGCYQLMTGNNPMQAQAMLNSTGRASYLRKRLAGKDSAPLSSPALFSQEHAMAKLLAYKHLPPSLELPGSSLPPPDHHHHQQRGSGNNRV